MPADRINYLNDQNQEEDVKKDRRHTYKVQTLLSFPYTCKDVFHLLKVTKITGKPFDLGFSVGLFFDLVDSLLPLLLLSVDHDNPSFRQRKGA